jgi:hypothetical protein
VGNQFDVCCGYHAKSDLAKVSNPTVCVAAFMPTKTRRSKMPTVPMSMPPSLRVRNACCQSSCRPSRKNRPNKIRMSTLCSPPPEARGSSPVLYPDEARLGEAAHDPSHHSSPQVDSAAGSAEDSAADSVADCGAAERFGLEGGLLLDEVRIERGLVPETISAGAASERLRRRPCRNRLAAPRDLRTARPLSVRPLPHGAPRGSRRLEASGGPAPSLPCGGVRFLPLS